MSRFSLLRHGGHAFPLQEHAETRLVSITYEARGDTISSVSDFLDVFVRVCRALLCGLFCLLFLNQNTYFGN